MRNRLSRRLLGALLLLALTLFAAALARPAYAGGVVGNGTPASCTDAAFSAALVGGGSVTFNCGTSPATILLASQKSISAPTTIDGGSTITLQAHGSRHFLVSSTGKLTVTNLIVRDGYAAGDGGSIFNQGTVVISNTLMANNSTDAGHSGGAIVNYGDLTIKQSTFEANAGGGGGAVYPRWSSSKTVVEHSIFRRNRTTSTVSGWGGAFLLWDGASLVISDSEIESNSAGAGGGIYNFPNSSIDMARTIIRGNTADYGGGIYNEQATLKMVDGLILQNVANRNGAGVANIGGIVSIEKSLFSENRVDYPEGTGGAVNNEVSYLPNNVTVIPKLTLIDSTATLNHAGMVGGAIFNRGDASLLRVTLNANTSPRGAAIFNYGRIELSTSTVSDNRADYHGGALYQSEGEFTAQYSTIADNTAGDDSAIYLDQGQHDATRFEGVIVSGGQCGGDVPLSGGYNLENGDSCKFDQPSDKLNTDPLLGPLAANGGSTSTRMPDPNGPVADAGASQCSSPDQRGEVRPLGGACDPGAVEAVALPPVCDGATCASKPPARLNDPQERTARQEAALGRLRAESTPPVDVLFDNSMLKDSSFTIPAPPDTYTDSIGIWFLNAHADLFGFTAPGDSWQLLRRSPDGLHLFFRQLHEGIPVWPSEVAVHIAGGAVTAAGGGYLPEVGLAITPTLTALQAEESAKAALDPTATIIGDTQLRYANLGLLGDADTTTHLAWQVALRAGPGDYTAMLDAHTGALIFKELRSRDGYDLDLENGNNEQLKDLCGLFDDDDIDSNFDADAQATSNNVGAAYSFWRNTFGRDSYDDDGEQIEIDIHVKYLNSTGGIASNASYSPGCDIFGASNGMVTRDILAHEFTHAVVHNEVGVPYSNQQGALDESLADTFGAFVDSANWTIGEGSPLGVIRTMSNPPANSDPDRMSNFVTLPNTSAGDNGGVHTNSGILNKAAFLVTDGQNGFNGHNVSGIGRGKAQRLYYNVLVNRLRSNSDFADMARQMVTEAKALRTAGAFTNKDVCSVIEAYAAVELGPADKDCNGLEDSLQDDDGDGVPNAYNDPAGTPWDNCRTIRNTNQADNDGDGLGDVCDIDSDEDGVSDWFQGNPNDNCRWVYNPSQSDRDKDGIGDACDDDTDGDSVPNGIDNCPNNANDNQSDVDHDGVGDVCDLDSDADLICNIGGPRASGLGLVAGQGCFAGQGYIGGLAVAALRYGTRSQPADNCPLTPNNNQADADTDGVGDACDLCPGVQSHDNGDPDHDGLGNPCDPDDYNDGVPDFQANGVTPLDNCREVPNPDQMDLDQNGVGFACDPAEQANWAELNSRLSRIHFKQDLPYRVPIENCPQCGTGYLPKGLETNVVLNSPVAVGARVVDSGGFVVAKSMAFAKTVSLTFKAVPFSGARVGVAGVASSAATATPNGLAPEDTRYYLEIVPAANVDINQEYDLTVETKTAIREPGLKSYLPLLWK